MDVGHAQITTARKGVTLLLSYLIFTKPLTEQHGTGLLLIVMGIVLKMVPEHKIPTWNAVQNAVVKHSKSTFNIEKNLGRSDETLDDGEKGALI